MYSNSKFQSAKTDLAFAFTHKPTDSMGQIESAFLRALLNTAALRGCVSDRDIQNAIESSGVFDLDLDEGEKDKIIADLWNIGDNYLGALSAAQAAELRRLRKLCILAAANRDALSQISEIL
jgi:hypothetical protein